MINLWVETALLAIGLYLLYVESEYKQDTCLIIRCNSVYREDTHFLPGFLPTRSLYSEYQVIPSKQPDQVRTILLGASQFAREQWLPSSCGYCYTCNEFRLDSHIPCDYSTRDTTLSASSSWVPFWTFYGSLFIVWGWLGFVANNFFRNATDVGLVAYVAQYVYLSKKFEAFQWKYRPKFQAVMDAREHITKTLALLNKVPKVPDSIRLKHLYAKASQLNQVELGRELQLELGVMQRMRMPSPPTFAFVMFGDSSSYEPMIAELEASYALLDTTERKKA